MGLIILKTTMESKFSLIDFFTDSIINECINHFLFFKKSFSSSPLVFSTIQEVTGDSPVDTKVQAVSNTSAQLLLCFMTSDDGCGSYPLTEVAWLAIDSSILAVEPQVESGLVRVVNFSWSTQNAITPYPAGVVPVLIVENQTNFGGQNGEVNSARNITNSNWQVRYCELDKYTRDNYCDFHIGEDIGWMAIEPGVIRF